MSTYHDFLERRRQEGSQHGFEPSFMPSYLFPFQRSLVEWAVRKGRCAIFADCGLGKTAMQLCWAENVVRETGRPVLILTPLAVAPQTVAEAEKFGIDCRRMSGGTPDGAWIAVTNYEKLHRFDSRDFGAIVCDESSILKNFEGTTKTEVTEFALKLPYRLLCTATAAPNDFVELGTSSEVLGEMGHLDMLARFFISDTNNHVKKKRKVGDRVTTFDHPQWRLKGHAEIPFWRWVCSWARACRKPSDLGFDDEMFQLPPLIDREHIVETRTKAEGMLFALPAKGLSEERDERRRTIPERCEMAAALVRDHETSIVWCHLNEEGDVLEGMIPNAIQVAGKHSDEYKEAAVEWFLGRRCICDDPLFRKQVAGWGSKRNGACVCASPRRLISKAKIFGFGLNLQHCAHVVTFASHSYEQHYQAVRRCWRFGQSREVIVDLIASEGEIGIKNNLRRKSDLADKMFSNLVACMNDSMQIDSSIHYPIPEEVPSWLSPINS